MISIRFKISDFQFPPASPESVRTVQARCWSCRTHMFLPRPAAEPAQCGGQLALATGRTSRTLFDVSVGGYGRPGRQRRALGTPMSTCGRGCITSKQACCGASSREHLMSRLGLAFAV